MAANADAAAPHLETSSPKTSTSSSTSSSDKRADRNSSAALSSLKRNLSYLFDPKSSAHRPAHLRTRALLKSLRYTGIFIFWRIVRYAKYAVVGSIVAAVSATALGGFVSGVGWVLAPPTLLGSLGVGLIWGTARWGFRTAGAWRGRGKGKEKGTGVERERMPVASGFEENTRRAAFARDDLMMGT